ncbi:hypothetical protein EV421DRAFT_726924 [Armillaria borealis]|uniref:Secreted protein n=1 Tax=Armillaria borealis TaxID=47425 RepID=A0AA39MPT1_9AGAR|nr:hypothetical protein EV421DRAFT_726924 [Armillaria borealis]
MVCMKFLPFLVTFSHAYLQVNRLGTGGRVGHALADSTTGSGSVVTTRRYKGLISLPHLQLRNTMEFQRYAFLLFALVASVIGATTRSEEGSAEGLFYTCGILLPTHVHHICRRCMHPE